MTDDVGGLSERAQALAEMLPDLYARTRRNLMVLQAEAARRANACGVSTEEFHAMTWQEREAVMHEYRRKHHKPGEW